MGIGAGQELAAAKLIHALIVADTEGFRAVCGRFLGLDEACKGGLHAMARFGLSAQAGRKGRVNRGCQWPGGVALRAPPPPFAAAESRCPGGREDQVAPPV